MIFYLVLNQIQHCFVRANSKTFYRNPPFVFNELRKKIAVKKSICLLIKAVKIAAAIIAGLFVLYAVLFSIAGTVAIFMAYNFVIAPIKQVKALKYINPKESVYMASYRASFNPIDSLKQQFMPLDSIATNLKNAVIAAEDDGFYTHPGFDIEAILAAIEYNKTHNAIKRGASTITQQLAKNLFLTGEKNFERKYKELAYTLLMERFLGKDRILELYLNYAQWGKTVFGCEAASRLYFKKSSKNLNRSEAARLAAVLAMPSKVSPNNPNSAFIGKRIAVIANNLYLHHQIDDSGYIALTGFPPPSKDSTDSATNPNDHDNQ
jgi:monofunctional biosynthetic peptidoglycan transglycosylase